MIYLTPEGKEKLEQELQDLKDRRPVITKKIAQAREQGDLSENAEYHDAKDEQGMVESRIREIEATLVKAEVVEKKVDSNIVGLGSKVTVLVNNEERKYEIVGVNEANPLERKISNESPLGRAFMGHKQGDVVEAEVPAGKMVFKIQNIE
ncbi:transcription elongation factor GreA [Patescibacteria group bacterium]